VRGIEAFKGDACDGLPLRKMHLYEVRLRKDHRGVDVISEALPFGRWWYGEPDAISNAIGYAKHRSRSHNAVIRVFDEAGNVIETHEHAGDFKEPVKSLDLYKFIRTRRRFRSPGK